MYTRAQMLSDLIELSTINFDINNIIQEADHFGEEPRTLARDVADGVAFRWNRMSRDEAEFNSLQARLENLQKFINKD